jgi:hypothetical protein
MHSEPIVHLKLTLKCPQVLDSQERRKGGRGRGNLYRTEVPEATVMLQEVELKDKVTEDKVVSHTDTTQ